MNQSWSFVIFGYNESKTLPKVLNDIIEFCLKKNIIDRELIIVDDGSTDDTRKIAESFISGNKDVIYLKHETNLGIGPALIKGYLNASKENVIAVPADAQFDIFELADSINFPEKSYLSFYRLQRKSYTSFRNLISDINGFINRKFLYLNVRDVNWVKAYKSVDLKSLDLKIKSSLVCSEICAKLNLKGFSAKEIVSVYHERTAGISKGASFKTLYSAVKDIVGLISVIRKYKNKIPAS